MRETLFSYTVEEMSLPELGRSGVTAYAYSGTVSASTAVQPTPESMSNTVIDTSAEEGRTTVEFISLQLYAAFLDVWDDPEQSASVYTVVPQQSQPAA